MKKRTISLLAAMALALLLCVPALAAGFDEAKLNFVTDEAGILTEQEWSELETRAEEISLKYQCGVYIIVLDDFTGYGTVWKTVRKKAMLHLRQRHRTSGQSQAGGWQLLQGVRGQALPMVQ
jgi:hypothetical protein